MSITESSELVPSSWRQLEETIQRLHAAAREPRSDADFYAQLTRDAAETLSAASAVIWRTVDGGAPIRLATYETAPTAEVAPDDGARRNQLTTTIRENAASVVSISLAARDAASTGPAVLLTQPIVAPAEGGATPAVVAVLELLFTSDADAATRDGWLGFAAALAEVARDYEAYSRLRRLSGSMHAAHDLSHVLLRVSTPNQLDQAAFELANEGRRVLQCDRLTVVVRRGRRWQVQAISGVDRVKANADVARRLRRLAQCAANWRAPLSYADAAGTEQPAADELPPQLVKALHGHVDAASTRQLFAESFDWEPPSAEGSDNPSSTDEPSHRPGVVLIAETFAAGQSVDLQEGVHELGQLCAPAIGRTAALDRWPARPLIRLSGLISSVRESLGIGRIGVGLFALTAIVAALLLVKTDWNVEAPAVLRPVVRHEVFASTSGTVEQVLVEHGQVVQVRQPLAVLHDPELSLQLQQVLGEIESTTKRLDAIAVARTDRDVRAEEGSGGLPLSSEEQLARERLSNLQLQRDLLLGRRESLTLRSPIAGVVLTRDIRGLLLSRPVERGQALLTVADLDSGWELVADVMQEKIARISEARASFDEVSVEYRLAGDLAESHSGTVKSISETAVLDAGRLQDEAPPIQVVIAVEDQPPSAARPGMSATVRIHCGRRSLGYAWLYDVAATLYRWWTF